MRTSINLDDLYELLEDAEEEMKPWKPGRWDGAADAISLVRDLIEDYRAGRDFVPPKLGKRQLKVLNECLEWYTIRSIDIAEKIDLREPLVSEILDRLEKLGLINDQNRLTRKGTKTLAHYSDEG